MRRDQFEHVIAAAADVCGEREIVVIGSQAILEIPARVARSESTVALCLEVHDLVLAKCAAGRDRDWQFAHDAIAAGLVRVDELLRRTEDLPEPPADHAYVRRMLEGVAAQV